MLRKKLIQYQAVAFACLLAAACGQSTARKASNNGEAQSASNGAAQFRVETVASGLEVPWAIAFTPDGRIREVAEGPDGAIYFSTSNRDGRGKAGQDDDRILRLVPVK